MPSYQPTPGTLPYSVCAFFRKNPNEELSRDDIAQKFDVERNAITAGLSRCFAANFLVEHGKRGDSTITAGSALAAWSPSTASLAPPPPPKTPRTYTPLPPVDFTKLKVERGLPVPAKKGGKGSSRWGPLFEKLDKPDTSIALKAMYYSALAKAAQDRTKTTGHKYVIRKLSDTEMRIWRTA